MNVEVQSGVDAVPLIPVCAIGASAGGIKALQSFFSAIDVDLGIAYVVIVHLAPEYPSQLDAILRATTTMWVGQSTLR